MIMLYHSIMIGLAVTQINEPQDLTLQMCVKLAVQQYGSIAVQQYGSIAVQQCGSTAVWQ